MDAVRIHPFGVVPRSHRLCTSAVLSSSDFQGLRPVLSAASRGESLPKPSVSRPQWGLRLPCSELSSHYYPNQIMVKTTNGKGPTRLYIHGEGATTALDEEGGGGGCRRRIVQ
ncbi:hypothetical protein ACS0TY_033983 [Phlomoides rotata]